MTRWFMWLWALAPVLACSEQQVTQAVVTLEIEDGLRARLSLLSVESLDERGRAGSESQKFALRGSSAEKPPFSFGAVPRAGDLLHLRITGYDQDEAAIEQRLNVPLPAGRATPITVVLRDACATASCGSDASCKTATLRDRVFACDPGAPAPPDDPCLLAPDGCACEGPETCSGDGEDEAGAPLDAMAADAGVGAEVASRDDGAVLPSEAGPTLDDAALAADSGANADAGDAAICAVQPRSNPKSCVNCTAGVIYCDFQGCVRGPCEHMLEGFSEGIAERLLEANRMYGLQFIATESGVVSWLGIGVLTGAGRGNPRFMIGLYENLPNGQAGQLLASTPPIRANDQFEEDTALLSVYGMEYPVQSSARLRAGSKYWLFVIANEPLSLSAQQDITRVWQKSIGAEDFAALRDRMPETPRNQTMLAVEPGPPNYAGDLYVITLPLPD